MLSREEIPHTFSRRSTEFRCSGLQSKCNPCPHPLSTIGILSYAIHLWFIIQWRLSASSTTRKPKQKRKKYFLLFIRNPGKNLNKIANHYNAETQHKLSILTHFLKRIWGKLSRTVSGLKISHFLRILDHNLVLNFIFQQNQFARKYSIREIC